MDEKGKRVAPYSEEAERGVLGAAIIDSVRVTDMCTRSLRLTVESFYLPAHRMLWGTLVDMFKKGLPVDLLTLGERLKADEKLDFVGGYLCLEGLVDSTPTAAHAEFYARVVRNKEIARRAIDEAGGVIDEAFGSDVDSEALIKGASERFLNLTEDIVVEVSNSVVIDDVTAQWAKAHDDYTNKRPVETVGLPIPFPRLNSLMNGLQTGMIFIAGRPSQGKTSVALNMTDHLAVDLGVPVAIVNMDMQNKRRLFQRSICNIAGVSLSKLKGGYPGERQFKQVEAAADRIKKAPIYVLDNENNLDAICAWIRMQVLKHGVKCVMIDYIQQIVTGDPKVDSFANSKLTVVSSRLKNLIGEMDIPGLILSQLSRNSDKNDREPSMADLRDSGSLEQDAFQVLLSWRVKGWDQDFEDKYHYRAQYLDLAKYQDGQTKKVECAFYGPYFKFIEAQPGIFEDLKANPPPLPKSGKKAQDRGGVVPEVF